jgi:hypothetical protein
MKNIYSKHLLNIIYSQKDNVIIDENDGMDLLITDTLNTKNKQEKMEKFNKLRAYINKLHYNTNDNLYILLNFINESFGDFFNDYYLVNSVLNSEESKEYFINILITIYRYILLFPNHAKIYNIDESNLKMLQAKANALKLKNVKPNYLKGDYDDERISDYTSDDNVMVYISSIDSYYHIYKSINIKEKSF